MAATKQHPDPLEAAVQTWRSDEAGREVGLSGPARSRVLARAVAGSSRTSAALRPLFFPWCRLVAAGAAPLLALTLAIGYLSLGGPVSDLVPGTAPVIGAEKRGDEVIFVIANGERAHRVYRSTSPLQFDKAPLATTRGGEFRDRIGEGPGLVFYRID